VSYGTRSYISMHKNVVASSVMLKLHARHNFYNMILKIRH